MSTLILLMEKLLEKLGEASDIASHPYVVFALPFAVLLGLFLNPEASIREFFCLLVETLIFPLPSTPSNLKLGYLIEQLSIASGGFIDAKSLVYLFSYVAQLATLGFGIKMWKLVKW